MGHDGLTDSRGVGKWWVPNPLPKGEEGPKDQVRGKEILYPSPGVTRLPPPSERVWVISNVESGSMKGMH
jgi:hypothetical protein